MFKRKSKSNGKMPMPLGAKNFADVLPFWDLVDDVMVLEDGRLVYGVWFEPPSRVFFTKEDLLNRQGPLKTVFDLAVPDGETLRTYTTLREAQDEALDETRQQAASCPDPVIKELTEARADMLQHKLDAGEVSDWSFFATVTVTPPADVRFSKDEPPSPEELASVVATAQAAQAALVAQLQAGGFGAAPMNSQDVFTQTFLYINPGWPRAPRFIPQHERMVRSVRRGRPDHQTLKRQLVATRGDNLNTFGPIMGDRYVEVISVGRLPESTETGYLETITRGLNGTYYVMIEATRENDYDVSNELEKQKGNLWVRVKAPGVVPNGRAANLLDEVQGAQKLEGHESRFEAAVNVILIAKDKAGLERMKRIGRGNMTRLNAGTPVSHGFHSSTQYFKLMPFTAYQSEFLFKPYTANVVDLFPPIAPWKGFEESAILFQSRDNSLIKFDLFTRMTRTPHFAVYAPPGSGKTVLAQSMLNAHLSKYPDSILLVSDAKQDFSYYFNSIEDHQIVNFGYDSEHKLNIFDLQEGVYEPDGIKMASLSSFLRIFFEKPLDPKEAGYEAVALTESISAVYRQFKERGRRPQISDLQRMLSVIEAYSDGKRMEERVKEAARSLAARMRRFLGEHAIARVIDCQSNVKIGSSRVYFNTYGISENDHEMKRVSHHIVRGQVWNTAKKYPPQKKKFVYIDEFEHQIQSDEEVKDIIEMLQVFRSFGVSFGIGTQDPKVSKRFGALQDSFAHLFIGGYSGGVAADVVRDLSLPSVMTHTLTTLRNVRGQYSEFALMVQSGYGSHRIGDVIKVEESKLGLWLFNSNQDEVKRKNQYVEAAGGNVMQGVRNLVRDLQGGRG